MTSRFSINRCTTGWVAGTLTLLLAPVFTAYTLSLLIRMACSLIATLLPDDTKPNVVTPAPVLMDDMSVGQSSTRPPPLVVRMAPFLHSPSLSPIPAPPRELGPTDIGGSATQVPLSKLGSLGSPTGLSNVSALGAEDPTWGPDMMEATARVVAARARDGTHTLYNHVS